MRSGLVGKAVWALGGTGALAVSGFAQGIITARFLGPAGTGTVGYMVWSTSIIGLLFNLGLTHSATKFVAECGATNAAAGAQAGVYFARRSALLSLIAVLVHAVAFRLWTAPGTPAEWVMCSVYFSLTQASGIFSGLAYGLQQFRLVTVVCLSGAALQLLGSLLLVPHFGVRGALAGLSLGMLPGAVLAAKMLFRRTTAKLAPAVVARIWQYTIPAWISALLFSLAWSRTEVFFLERFRDAPSVAYFTVGLTVANLATQVPQMLMNALFPHFSGLAATNPQALVNVTMMSVRLAAWTMIPAAVFAAAGAPFWITTVYGARFAGAGAAGIVMTLLAAMMLFSPLVQYLFARNRSDLIMYQNLLSGVLSVSLCWGLVPVLGIAGALIARSVSNLAGVAFWLESFRRLTGVRAPLFQVGKIALVALFSASPILVVSGSAVPSVVGILAATLAAAGLYLGLTRIFGLLERKDADPILRWVADLPLRLAAVSVGTFSWLVGRRAEVC